MGLEPGAVATPTQLFQGALSATAATLYTAPANTSSVPAGAATTTVTSWVICNTSATASGATTIYLVPSGGTAGTDNALLYNFQLAPNDTLVGSALGIQMLAGSTLQALGSGTVAITLSGVALQ